MSMIFMVQAMRVKVGNAARKLVLLKLADNANDQGKCWPSYGHIAEACEMDKRTVMRHIQKLSDDGFVTVTPRMGKNGNSSNVYSLHLGGVKMPPLSESAANDPSDNLSPPSDRGSLALVTDDHPPSDPVSPRTSHRTSQLEPISPKVPLEDEKPELEILDYLNQGRKVLFEKLNLKYREFRGVEQNLKPIKSIIKAKYTTEQIKLVIDHLLVRWGNDPEMRDYISPASIFRKTKFETKLEWAQSWRDNGCQPMAKVKELNWDDTSWGDNIDWSM
ncbi:helix-turn-helix domain-containing protein [Vibrio parahaemolyticus]|uniref:helix-turn-helix domain-containing protein n=1 Tax=Vibrio parahaemolyticus TaxID=670 RepID=UPI001B839233|nr:conserved phage C-terminal domain-containing protein [Vibrio parahaemolyticus]